MSITKERIEKVVDVLAKAACKEYQHRIELSPDAADDDFLQIEVGLNVVLEDLDSLVDDENRSFLLNELDGFAVNDGLLTIASTNHPERLDRT